MSAPTRRSPGAQTRAPHIDAESTTKDRTAGLRRRDDLGRFTEDRAHVRARRPKISSAAQRAGVELAEFLDDDELRTWFRTAMEASGIKVSLVLIDVATLPAIAQELAAGPGLTRRASLVATAERIAVATVSMLSGGGR